MWFPGSKASDINLTGEQGLILGPVVYLLAINWGIVPYCRVFWSGGQSYRLSSSWRGIVHQLFIFWLWLSPTSIVRTWVQSYREKLTNSSLFAFKSGPCFGIRAKKKKKTTEYLSYRRIFLYKCIAYQRRVSLLVPGERVHLPADPLAGVLRNPVQQRAHQPA